MGYWKSKVLPKIKKIFDKESTTAKKAAAAEACKSFDDSKEEYSKEVEEKKTELQPKVVEIFEALSPEMKSFVKDPKETSLRKNSAGVQKFLSDLANIEFPGAKPISDLSSEIEATRVYGPIKFVMEKVYTFISEEKETIATETTTEIETTTATEDVHKEEKDIVVEDKLDTKKDEQVVIVAAAADQPPPPPAKAEEPTKT